MEAGPVLDLVDFTHKNRLQEFAQRASIPLPLYQTLNEGTPHLPQFRSTVTVDGTEFVSPCVFVRRKVAEQHVAKLALERIFSKIRQEGVPLINNDAAFCKTILHEYAAKMKMELPKYTTTRSEGLLPTFIATVVFDGKMFSGDAGRSKREAEQLGARTVIGWLLGQHNASISMAEIIKSKGKLFDAFRRGNMPVVPQDSNVPLKTSDDTLAKERNMNSQSTNSKLPVLASEHSVPPPLGNPKDRHICDVCSGSIGGTAIAPTLQNNNRPEGSTNGAVNAMSNNSCPGQVIQVKKEDQPEDLLMHQRNLQTSNPSSGEKRSGNSKGGNRSKKIRTNEKV